MKVAVGWRHFSSVEHYRQPSTFMYIGSTSQSVFRRESNRLSVAKKLLAGGEAQAELAIRYWVSNDCLQDFTLFLVTPCSSYRQAWVTEHCLIGMWQPKLNHPYITSFLRRSALGFRPNKLVRQTVASRFGLRLWRKLRKKLHRQLQPESFQLKTSVGMGDIVQSHHASVEPHLKRPRDCAATDMCRVKFIPLFV